MRKKEAYEGRVGITASLSLRQPLSISIERELHSLFRASSIVFPGGWTELNRIFLAERSGMTEKEFNEAILNYVKKITNLENRGDYSMEFRKFLAEMILKMDLSESLKQRWNSYLKNKEYE